MAQEYTIWLPVRGSWVQSRKIPHALEQLSLCTAAVEPVLWSPGAPTTEAHAPESQCYETREASEMRGPHITAKG